jgi:hypothetical protein
LFLEDTGWLAPGSEVPLIGRLRPPLGQEELILLYAAAPTDLRETAQANNPPPGVGVSVERYRLLP